MVGPLATLEEVAAGAMTHVELLVVLPVDAAAGIHVPEDEDPDLREAMDAALLDLVDDASLLGATASSSSPARPTSGSRR